MAKENGTANGEIHSRGTGSSRLAAELRCPCCDTALRPEAYEKVIETSQRVLNFERALEKVEMSQRAIMKAIQSRGNSPLDG